MLVRSKYGTGRVTMMTPTQTLYVTVLLLKWTSGLILIRRSSRLQGPATSSRDSCISLAHRPRARLTHRRGNLVPLSRKPGLRRPLTSKKSRHSAHGRRQTVEASHRRHSMMTPRSSRLLLYPLTGIAFRHAALYQHRLLSTRAQPFLINQTQSIAINAKCTVGFQTHMSMTSRVSPPQRTNKLRLQHSTTKLEPQR
jgi:hypothetical protein